MNKGLEALNTIIENGYIKSSVKELKIIEKELKALDIIKNKSVNTRNLIIYCFEMNDTYEKYVELFNYCSNYWELGKELLTREEYDLLKEAGL